MKRRTPSPTPPSRAVVRAVRTLSGGVWLGAAAVARYPKSSAALAGAVVATSPVTVGHVTGVVVAGSVACGMAWIGGGDARMGASSLVDMGRFRKRRRRIRSRWVTVMTDAGLVKSATNGGSAKRKPKILRIRRTALGVAVTANTGRVSVGAGVLRGKADVLRHGFGCRDIRATDVKPGTVRLDLRYEDPFRKVIRFAELPPASRPLHAVIGFDEDRMPIEKDLRLPNLIVGAQGAGKSSEVWTLLAAIQAAGIPHRVRVFDPKGGQEFADLEDAAYYYERDPTRWGLFLQRAHRALAARQEALRAARLRVNQFTDEHPLDLMLIDELLTALAMSNSGSKVKVGSRSLPADKAFLVYLSAARSAGFTVVACSQLGQKATIGEIRDLFPYTTCLRVASDDIVNIILGPGGAKAYPAHELRPNRSTAGIGWMSTERGVVKYRAAYLSDLERGGVRRRMRADSARFRAQARAELEEAA